jgi:hypothetical protein
VKGTPGPRDPIQLGKVMVDIAAGEVPDAVDNWNDVIAAVIGRKGGVCLAYVMTPKQRAARAKKAVTKRRGKK